MKMCRLFTARSPSSKRFTRITNWTRLSACSQRVSWKASVNSLTIRAMTQTTSNSLRTKSIARPTWPPRKRSMSGWERKVMSSLARGAALLRKIIITTRITHRSNSTRSIKTIMNSWRSCKGQPTRPQMLTWIVASCTAKGYAVALASNHTLTLI